MNKQKHSITVKVGANTVDSFILLITKPRDLIQSFWYTGKWYEAGLIKFIQTNYKGGTFIDIGGSIGNHTVAFSNIADTVYTFEPSIKFYYHLQSNLLINEIKNVITYNIGLGDNDGIYNFSIDNISDGGGIVNENGTEKIIVLKLDNFKLKNVKLIKIDAEGFEEKILIGALNTIKNNLPDVFVETTTYEEYEKTCNFFKKIDKRYKPYKTIFNNTPTILLTIKDCNKFKDLENNNQYINNNPVRDKFLTKLKELNEED